MELVYDVVIIGGGTSGFAAAVASARHGAKTLVIEENAFLGGMATGGMVSQFMGFADDETFPARGVVGEVLDKLHQHDACEDPKVIYLAGRKEANVLAVSYDSDILKFVLDEIIEEAGADILFHAKYVDAKIENNRVRSVDVAVNGEIIHISAKVFIDASFHGVLAYKCNIPLQEDYDNKDFQPGSLMFKMADVNSEEFLALSQEEKKSIARNGIDEGQLYVETIMSRPTGKTGIHFHNMSRVPNDPTDPVGWSKAEIAARKQVMNISEYMIRNVPGYQNAVISSTGSFLGLRDSRRFTGSYTLTKDDVMEGVQFEDSIAASSFPIDIHPKDTGFSFVKPSNGKFFIPYRSIVCKEINNLILAGRIISADKYAHASLRVMITCMRIGEAAGIAASMAVRDGTDTNKINGQLIGLM